MELDVYITDVSPFALFCYSNTSMHCDPGWLEVDYVSQVFTAGNGGIK